MSCYTSTPSAHGRAVVRTSEDTYLRGVSGMLRGAFLKPLSDERICSIKNIRWLSLAVQHYVRSECLILCSYVKLSTGWEATAYIMHRLLYSTIYILYRVP